MNLPRSHRRFLPRRFSPAWLPCVLLVACDAVSTAELRHYEGEARDPDSGALLYREKHLVRLSEGEPQERLVLYRCADGTAFALKQVDYRTSRTAPEFTLEDVRTGYREGLRRDSYAFELRKVGEHSVHGQPALRLRLKLGGWLRWLAPAIDVSYAVPD